MDDKKQQDDMTLNARRSQTVSSEEAHDLKTIREAHGITLQDIFSVSRVSVVNLDAIEKGNYKLLPPPFIAKSFIQTYAQAIGVDAEAIINNYEEYMKTVSSSFASPSGIFGKGGK